MAWNAQLDTSYALSADLSCLSSCLNIPLAAIQAIGKKATELLATDSAIVPALGHPADSCMVLSRSGKRPHLVTPKKNGGFSCDEECQQYRSSKVCSHVVAVAERSQRLRALLLSLQREKSSGPSLSKLALTTMPKGRGRKGSKVPPRKKQALDVQQRFELTSIATMQMGQQTNIGQVYVTQASQNPSSSCYPYAFPSTSYSPQQTPSWFYQRQCSADPTDNGVNPFRLTFITGNISVCYDCQSKYVKDAGPPHDICVFYMERCAHSLSMVCPSLDLVRRITMSC